MSVHTSTCMCIYVCVWLLCPFLQFGCAYEPAVGFPLSLSNHCLYLCSVHSFHHSTSAFFFKTTMKKHKVFFLHIFVVSRYSMQKKYLKNIGRGKMESGKKFTCKIAAKRWKMLMKERCACKNSTHSKVEKSMWILCRKKIDVVIYMHSRFFLSCSPSLRANSAVAAHLYQQPQNLLNGAKKVQ